MTTSRIDRLFNGGGGKLEPRKEAIVAHCIVKRVDGQKEVIHACFASAPERNITISIHPAMRADMNSHGRFAAICWIAMPSKPCPAACTSWPKA